MSRANLQSFQKCRWSVADALEDHYCICDTSNHCGKCVSADNDICNKCEDFYSDIDDENIFRGKGDLISE